VFLAAKFTMAYYTLAVMKDIFLCLMSTTVSKRKTIKNSNKEFMILWPTKMKAKNSLYLVSILVT